MDAVEMELLWLEIIENPRHPNLALEKVSPDGDAPTKKLSKGEYEVALQKMEHDDWLVLVEDQAYGLPVKRLRGYERAGRVSVARFDGTAFFDD